MTFPEEQIKEWMGRIRHLCCRWRSHPQFDDIVACAYLGMWRALQHAEDTPGRDHTGLALDGAWKGAHQFLSSHACITSRSTCRGKERFRWLSLEDYAEGDDLPVPPGLPYVPDFAPALIDYLQAEAELSRMPARKRRLLILACFGGYTRQELPAVTGLSIHQVHHILRGVPGLRTCYGAEPK